MHTMRSIFLLGLAVLCFSGCAKLHTAGSMATYDGVSSDYPGDAQALAVSAAEEMAHRYPPGRTTLALAKTDSVFGQDLESALRERGFSIAAPDAAGIQVAYTLDVIRDETPPACYLRVRTSDHTAFGTLRVLTGEPRRAKGEGTPSESAPSDSASAPEPHPLRDTPPAVAQAPRPMPVMPAKLERRESASNERAGIPVRVKSTAAKIAKRNRISVEEFCRLNDVAPDTIIPAGRRVLLHEPHEPAVALMPLPEPARASSPSESRQSKFTPIRTTAADTPTPATIQPAVSVKPVETSSVPVKAPEPAPAVSSPPAAPSPVSRLLSENAAPVKPAANSPVTVLPAPAAPATVPPAQPAPLPGQTSMPASAPSGPAPTVTPAAAPQVPNPAPAVPPGQTPASPPPAPPAPPAPNWNIAPGSLHAQLEHWAMRAHYQLIWKATHDFELEARADFEGDFETVIKQLFAGLHRGGHALRVTLYRGNNVLEVAEN
ncbi:MAG: TcpQ domain-containing protein [Desulfovibrio sp.]